MLMVEPTLHNVLTGNAILLTPNTRLARSLLENYNNTQTTNAWVAPAIYSLEQWTHQLYQQLANAVECTPPVLLTELEEQLLWQQLIQQEISECFNVQGLADKIIQAKQFCDNWRVALTPSLFLMNEDTTFFYTLISAFKSKHPNVITSSELFLFLLEQLQTTNVPLPDKIILAFFEDITPAFQALLDHLSTTKHVTISTYDSRLSPNQITRLEFGAQHEEYLSAIHWADNELRQGKSSIGIVVPELRANQQTLLRYLKQGLPKGSYNMSLGKPLSDYPLVRNALQLLRLSPYVITLAQLHMLFHSHYLHHAQAEAQLRAQLYQSLQKHNEASFSTQECLRQLAVSSLGSALAQFYEKLSLKKVTLAMWKEAFEQALELLGFPGEPTLSSVEYQTYHKFKHVLAQFASLFDLQTTYTKENALTLLEWVLSKTQFQPKASQPAPIQVLGLYEALGLHFDSLWIMSVNEKQFPPPIEPTPFIPMELQRKYQLPFSSPEREYELSKAQLERLLTSAHAVTVSHTTHVDSVVVLASCFTQSYPLSSYPNVLNESRLEDACIEAYAPKLQHPLMHQEKVKGGTFLVKEQAQCPFRAFSKYRLKINEPVVPSEGLDPMTRGTLTHKLLEHFWLNVKTQEQLLELDSAKQLLPLIDTLIHDVLAPIKKEKRHTFTPIYTTMEHQRLSTLLLKFLELEKARPPFKVIHIETEQNYVIEGLDLKLRVDRVDELENGDWAVIDYKTGLTSVASWFDERLSEPQLPIYALTEANIKSLIYAQLQAKNISYKGITANEVQIPGVQLIEKKFKVAWLSQLSTWQEQLTLLVQEFMEGQIHPQPLSPTLCMRCCYSAMCAKHRFTPL